MSQYPGDDAIDLTADINKDIIIPESDIAGKDSIKVTVSFGNSCKNNRDDVSTIQETSCFGSGYHNGSVLGSNGKPRVFTSGSDFNFKAGEPIKLYLTRVGNCRCSYSVRVNYKTITNSIVETPVGGLRIKKN
ncbi:hypothetical protein HX13_20720 [Chryseobacterium sp. P1-3]|uniref:hypothetical protein n=1 Tax=Chryseobacterium sp. (strain P1-3) TaxID=1517683 RepID=UPI0004E6F908|nr:hypothetical protein [Chryseobacterium sp. P1-3]KFF73381.1 hypothetical protein HX13_20720 [Chryseobacterium sp. P1-3]